MAAGRTLEPWSASFEPGVYTSSRWLLYEYGLVNNKRLCFRVKNVDKSEKTSHDLTPRSHICLSMFIMCTVLKLMTD